MYKKPTISEMTFISSFYSDGSTPLRPVASPSISHVGGATPHTPVGQPAIRLQLEETFASLNLVRGTVALNFPFKFIPFTNS